MKNYILVDPTLLKEQAGLTPAAERAGLTVGADGQPLKPRTRTPAGGGKGSETPETNPKKKFLHFEDGEGNLIIRAGTLGWEAIKLKGKIFDAKNKNDKQVLQTQLDAKMEELKLIQEEFEFRATGTTGEPKKEIEGYINIVKGKIKEVKDMTDSSKADPAVQPNPDVDWERLFYLFLSWAEDNDMNSMPLLTPETIMIELPLW